MKLDEFINLFNEAVNSNNLAQIEQFQFYMGASPQEFVQNCASAMETNIGLQIAVIFTKIGMRPYQSCSQEVQ